MPIFAVKLAYAIAMTAISASLLLVTGRSGERLGKRWAWLLAPPLVVAAVTAMEVSAAPNGARTALFMGSTWQTWFIGVVTMSLAVFAALLLVFLRLTPTRLALAGFVARICSGAMASIIYALYCPETAAGFMLAWYSLGMLVPGIAGALLGPRLLRW